MGGVKAHLSLKNFKQLEKALSPKAFERRLKKEVGKATKLNGLLAEAEIKEDINSGRGRFKKNRPLTIALKGSSRPLVAGGDLVKSINSQAESWAYVVIGVLRSEPHTDKSTGKTQDLVDIATILHDGATVKVTPKMRRMFAALSREIDDVKPLKASTKVLVIPPRPFLKGVMKKRMIKEYQRNWQRAINRAMRGRK